MRCGGLDVVSQSPARTFMRFKVSTKKCPPRLQDECEIRLLVPNSAHTSFCTVKAKNRRIINKYSISIV